MVQPSFTLRSRLRWFPYRLLFMSTPLAATVRLPKLVRQVPHKWIDARHPDWDTSGALQIEAAGSCDCFQITSQPEFNFRNSSFIAVRRSGGIDSAHAGVSNKPRATNAAKHSWIQNATKW